MNCKSRPALLGFSLVEVNLAILMVAVGLLALFSLFPLGLRESDMAIIDTQEAMFAEHVLSAIEGNAVAVTDAGMWKDAYTTDQGQAWARARPLVDALTSGIPELRNLVFAADVGGGKVTVTIDRSLPSQSVEFPSVTDPSMQGRKAVVQRLRFKWTCIIDGTNRRRIELMVRSGKYGLFSSFATTYYTELVFLGM